MKHGKKPTKKQCIFIRGKRLNPDNWFVVKDNPTEMVLVHRHFETKVRTITKGCDSDR